MTARDRADGIDHGQTDARTARILVARGTAFWLSWWLMHSADGVGSEPTRLDHSHISRVQTEGQEIAEVLGRRTGKTVVEVWQEALSLYRVRYEMKALPGPEESENARPTDGAIGNARGNYSGEGIYSCLVH